MPCRDCLCPVVLTRGTDQMPLSTKFEMRSDAGVVHNYGRMLVELSATIPDGIVCFFVSYLYMDQIVAKWHDMGILQVCSCQGTAACCKVFSEPLLKPDAPFLTFHIKPAIFSQNFA